MWTLHVLGPVRLVAADGTDVARLGTKTEAVLTCLAARGGQPCSRRNLLSLLWPDTTEADARSALRQWLFGFRRRFGESIVLGSGELLRLDAATCATDLDRFTRLAGSSEPGDWAQACAAWRGELAEGLSVGAAFDHWLAGEREGVRHSAHALLERMARNAPDATQVRSGTELAQRLVAGDPLDEAAHRALMLLHDAGGQRGKAMEAWLQCRRALMAEAGVPPSRETAALHESIHAADSARLVPPAPPFVRLDHVMNRPAFAPGSDDAAQAAEDHLHRGMVLFLQAACAEENVRARAAFEMAAALRPDAPEAACLVARTYLHDYIYGWNGEPCSNFRRAMACASAVYRDHPDHPQARATRARLAVWQGAHRVAIEEARRAVAGSNRPGLLGVLAEALLFAGRHAEAVVVARQAQQADPGNPAMFRWLEGAARFGLGDLDGALRAYGSALRRKPHHCLSWAGLAAVHAELGDHDAARACAVAASGRRFSLAFAQDTLPFAEPAVRARWVRSWAAAGMQEAERAVDGTQAPWASTADGQRHPVFGALVPAA